MKRVLIVDDDTWTAEHYAQWCRREGWGVTHAEHALQAVESINQSLPQVIVLDMFLPGANGLTLLHELQSYPDTSQLPVVLCTSSAKEFADIDLSKYGVQFALDKTTLDRHEFLGALRKAME